MKTAPLTAVGFGAKFGTMMQWIFEQADPASRKQMADELDAQFEQTYGKPLFKAESANDVLPAKELQEFCAPVPLPLLHALAGESASKAAKKRGFELWAKWMATWHGDQMAATDAAAESEA